MTRRYLDDLTYKIIGAAIEVHKVLGPGQLESVYHKCMEIELEQRRIAFQSERDVEIVYKGVSVNTDLRCDILVEEAIVVELKAVQEVLPVHKAQILSYMSLLEKPKGILINFNVTNIYNEGQQTFVNKIFERLDD
ncbi:MAG: GxxExxY protein [Chitinophagales bacterium]|nr:GxxExxY protein [Chitinophagales bacterium]